MLCRRRDGEVRRQDLKFHILRRRCGPAACSHVETWCGCYFVNWDGAEIGLPGQAPVQDIGNVCQNCLRCIGRP